MANFLKSNIDKLFVAYKKRIVENPQLVSEVEVAVKWLSYFSVGHFNNSNLALEIIYSMPNLIMLSNDMLMYHSSSPHPKIPQYESKIKIWLTVLEYTQTLLEVTGKKLGGEIGRWVIIAVVQFSKSVLRLLLIYVYKERITKNPSVPPLNRKIFNKASGNLQIKEGFKLKRSGVVVRAIKYAEPVQLRTWKALPCDADENQNFSKSQWSDISLKLAESLYVIKPLIYLGCISVTSQHHWQPWILSFLVDTTSLYAFTRCSRSTVFNKEENVELISRKISLLLYILKSPFYEKYGRAKINVLLDRISASVPLINLLVNSLKRNLEYINTTSANRQCLCIPGTSCPIGVIDIRIVNTGNTCSPGYVYCCSGGSDSWSNSWSDSSCGIRKISPSPHPVGQAAYGAYPWQVAILANDNKYIGGGVLISSTHVLTVAHKVANYVNGGIKARLGEWDAQATTEPNPYVDIPVSKVTLHPDYNSQNLKNDVAVLKLSSAAPIATSPNINTACRPPAAPAAGTRCWVSGWGKNAFGPDGKYQSILKEVDVPVLTQANCQMALRDTRLGQFFVLDNSFMCAGAEAGKDACTGDGGSSLVCSNTNGQYYVAGLVTWGIGCAGAGVPGVYTNVFNFLSWIMQQMT